MSEQVSNLAAATTSEDLNYLKSIEFKPKELEFLSNILTKMPAEEWISALDTIWDCAIFSNNDEITPKIKEDAYWVKQLILFFRIMNGQRA